MTDDATARRRPYAPFLVALWSFDRSCRGKGGQTITTNTCLVCHKDYVSGSTAGGALCDPCLATLRDLLKEEQDDRTARRKAMAENYADEVQAMATDMRKQHDKEMRKAAWDTDRYWLCIARAAKEAQLNLGNTGPRIYLMGANAVPVTDELAEATDKAAEKQRKVNT